jgi:hypothetical protein
MNVITHFKMRLFYTRVKPRIQRAAARACRAPSINLRR